MDKRFLALLLSLSSAAAYADGSSWKEAKVTDVTIYATGGPGGKGYMVVTFASNGVGTPRCASGYPKSLVIDISIDGGRLVAATVEQSLMLGSTLTVMGSGTCAAGINPSMETLASIQATSMR